jgi:hypothetical protein
MISHYIPPYSLGKTIPEVNLMFFIARIIIAWSLWFLLADKRRWKEIFPVCILASFLGQITDEIVHYFPYWEYYGPDLHPLIVNMADDIDVYPVVTYFFIQILPKNHQLWTMLLYWFAWSGLAITIEYVHIATGHMTHLNGWTYWHSYISDWFLFWIFYQFHKKFELSRLSNIAQP